VQTCECCGKCCVECGKCTDECCRACNAACAPCCACLASSCSFLTTLYEKPFGGCVIFTFLTNLVPLLVLIYFVAANFSSDCSRPLPAWIVVCLGLFVINTIFGAYIYRRVSALGSSDPTTHPKWDPRLNYSRNMFNISLDFWLNDPFVCIYIVVSIFTIVWSVYGLVWTGQSKNDPADLCPTPLIDASTAGAIIMFVYIGLGVFFVTMTLCTGYLEHCLNDCNLWHCICCCFYYPFFYHFDANYESDRARQARERHQQQQGNGQLVVQVHQPMAQPMVVHPVITQPVNPPAYQQHQQPTFQQPVSGGFMQPPQAQTDYQRRSLQAAPAVAATAPPAYSVQSVQPVQVQIQQQTPPPDNVEKAKQKAAAVAEATGEKLKSGAQAFKAWWDKPKDAPR